MRFSKQEMFFLTFLVLGDDRVAELNELASSDLVDGLNSEVVLSIGDEVFDGPAHLVLSGHHVDVRPPAGLTPLHTHKQKKHQFNCLSVPDVRFKTVIGAQK